MPAPACAQRSLPTAHLKVPGPEWVILLQSGEWAALGHSRGANRPLFVVPSVVALDISESKLGWLVSSALKIAIDSSREKPAEIIRRMGGAHVVVNFVCSQETITQSFGALRRAGTLVLVGLPAGDFHAAYPRQRGQGNSRSHLCGGHSPGLA